jgi:folate-binding protein YgfZ
METTGDSKTTTANEALRDGAALLDRPLRVMRLTGKDPIGMLNAVLTNQVPQEEHRGAYALLLDPKGRIGADLRVLKEGEEVLVLTEREGFEAAHSILGRYAPFSRVKLEALPNLAVLGVYGPRASELLGVRLDEHESATVEVGGTELLAVGVASPVAGYDLTGPAEALREARGHLAKGGALPLEGEAYEAARVAAGVPRFGQDFGPENFPGEAGLLSRAVSLKKGCYPGQETVARMHYRGSPNKRLYRLVVGESVASGAEISQNGKAVGRITSVSPLSAGAPDERLALGYLARSSNPEGPLEARGAAVRALYPVE